MSDAHSHRCALPLMLPEDRDERLLLVLLRRMAIHGLHDARASWMALENYGIGFRKPLVLMRCFLHELASASQRNIRLAPCCAPRMTRDEGLMLAAIDLPSLDGLEALTDAGDVSRVMSAAHALRGELVRAASAP